MCGMWAIQSSDIRGGFPPHNWKIKYSNRLENTLQAEGRIILNIDAAISPSLSDSEIADIEASLIEFSTTKRKIYRNVNDLLKDLHAEWEKFHKEQEEIG